MSTTRPSRPPDNVPPESARTESAPPEIPRPPTDIRHLRARRRRARERRRVARVDVAIGLIGALVLVLATPGLAITAVIALVVLLVCAGTFIVERRPRRRHASRSGERDDAPPDRD